MLHLVAIIRLAVYASLSNFNGRSHLPLSLDDALIFSAAGARYGPRTPLLVRLANPRLPLQRYFLFRDPDIRTVLPAHR